MVALLFWLVGLMFASISYGMYGGSGYEQPQTKVVGMSIVLYIQISISLVVLLFVCVFKLESNMNIDRKWTTASLFYAEVYPVAFCSTYRKKNWPPNISTFEINEISNFNKNSFISVLSCCQNPLQAGYVYQTRFQAFTINSSLQFRFVGSLFIKE